MVVAGLLTDVVGHLCVAVRGAEASPPPSMSVSPTATPLTLDTYLRKNLFFLLFLLRVIRGVFLLSGNVSELYLDDAFFLSHSHLFLFRPHFAPSHCRPVVNRISRDPVYDLARVSRV